MHNKAKQDGGFTLIELLVVIAIIALLLSIMMPALGMVKQKAKMVLCKNNQRQLLIGANAYASANGNKFPPTVAATGRPNVINRPQDGKSAGEYLYTYIKDASVYNCPMTGFDADEKITMPSGDTYSYQELYENPEIAQQNSYEIECQYALLWNYEAFQREPVFIGPGPKSKNKLLICDTFMYTGALALGKNPQNQNKWACSHPFDTGTKDKTADVAFFIGSGDVDDINTDNALRKIKMNAGYTDGHVEVYEGSETVRQQVYGAWAKTFIPEKWK
ncbi:putative major pilin subunit [Anaerohalosphaera lusitana]|uniref:Putative major pilin subunit n=1 Tax=Anaerohalosphaera lusitana TaxID=1936003 RepID=A0A1U9NKQ0_9BACT|nr:type II secretion system protein [Anaerohalosphaera lusitana]AQT68511.1 putative major pilin subunit [Anaerohalosphaera lusitana]